MALIKNTLKNYPNSVFIETGTWLGEGVQAAREANCFDKILSIELSRKLYIGARKRFWEDSRVKVFHGDSSVVLWKVIKSIKEKITFLLDAHSFEYGGIRGNAQIGLEQWHLVKELQTIIKHPRKDHTIIIDDIRLLKLFNTNEKQIHELLFEINCNYHLNCIAGIVDNDKIEDRQVLVAEVRNE